MTEEKITTIGELGLSVRAYNALKRLGIRNVEELKNFDENAVIKNMPPLSSSRAKKEIKEKMLELGITPQSSK